MIYRRIVNGVPEEKSVDSRVFNKHYDVIVAGVGTAGIYAIIAAGKNGASVLGVDRLSSAGGMGTGGYVSGYYYGKGGGLHVGVDEEAEDLAKESFLDSVEPKKYLFENMAAENNSDLLLETVITGVFLEGKQAKGISVISQGETLNFSCDILIDATADASLCVMAGCETNLGRENDGKTRPFTSVKVFLKSDGVIGRTNHDSGYVNQYDPFELSEGILHAHSSQLLDEFSSSDQRVLFYAPFVGIREGRLIEAEKVIRAKDVIECKLEKETLFYGYSDFDKHGKDHALETEDLQDLYIASNLSTACFSVPVTVQSLVPKGYKSLMVAGRHLGVDHDVASLLRMKQDMQKCGESAGVIAALAVKKGIQPTEVPYEEIKPILEETGCLTEDHNLGVRFDDYYRREAIEWMDSPDKIRAELATDMPGIAIYSCKRIGKSIRPYLKEWMEDSDEMLRYNSAIALGLIGDKD
ncbi:MAG: FAD-dependent oxidoreductase, partial [Clostridiales bacterium]|nr:FAD-dependent oxidoreductase [Clostridiales bacterium]